MIEIRKLAAIDVAFLGSKIIISEFVVGVLLPVALGVFIASRAHTVSQWLLSLYFVALGANYIPLLVYAIGIARRGDARLLVADEIASDKRAAMRKYRRGSVLLLLPFVVPALALIQRNASNTGR